MRSNLQRVFKYYGDPSHGWAKVSRKILAELGLCTEITPYSYQRGGWVYLEEDRDLSLFIDTYKRLVGKPPEFRDNYTNGRPSRIRSYPSYHVTDAERAARDAQEGGL